MVQWIQPQPLAQGPADWPFRILFVADLPISLIAQREPTSVRIDTCAVRVQLDAVVEDYALANGTAGTEIPP